MDFRVVKNLVFVVEEKSLLDVRHPKVTKQIVTIIDWVPLRNVSGRLKLAVKEDYRFVMKIQSHSNPIKRLPERDGW